MQSHSKQKNTPITRQTSKIRHLTQTTSQKRKRTPPPLIRTSTPTQIPQVSQGDSQFLYENTSPSDNQLPTIVC